MSKTSYNFAATGWWKKPFPDGVLPTWKDATVTLITTPKGNPRQSEGLLLRRDVEQDPNLYVIANKLGETDPFIRDLGAAIFMKGGPSTAGGDSPTPFGWASDYTDMMNWPVYASTSTARPETVYYLPVNQGSFQYGAFRATLDPNATAAHQGTPEETTTETTMEPPDLTTGYSGGAQTTGDRPVEFSVMGKRTLFVALSPAESAAQDSPHPGVSIINKGAWQKYQPGLKWDADSLGLRTFVERGWRGIGDKPILAYQGGTSVSSAGQELGSAMEAAERGDRKALDALGRVGITYHPSPIQKAEDFLGW